MIDDLAVGVDVGGTRIKGALIDVDRGTVLTSHVVPTAATSGASNTIGRIVELLEQLGDTRSLPVGLALPGNVDARNRVVNYAPALGDDWAGLRLLDEMTVDAPIEPANLTLINDVQAMTVAEHRFGAAQGHLDVLGVGIGTGVGGGLLLGGRLHAGVDSTAGSIGHTTVVPDGRPCICGSRGCLEQYASGRAITRAAGVNDAEAAAAAAAAGDERSLSAFRQAGEALGIAIANVCTMLTPTMVVIGGGVAAAGDLLLDPARREVSKRVRAVSMHRTTITMAEIGPLGGAVGAAVVAGARIREPAIDSHVPKEH